jgi:DNA repair protein RadA
MGVCNKTIAKEWRKLPGIPTADDIYSRLASCPSLSSGCAALDELLGGGYRPGRLVEIYGRSNSGKTQVAMQAVLLAARNGYRALFIDSEGTFRPERVELMARARGWEARGLLDRVDYVRVDTSAEQSDVVRAIRDRPEVSACRIVAVDTVTRNFTLDYPGSANLVRRQGALGVHLSEMARDAVLRARTYVLTNRVTFGQTDGETRIGGSTIEQLVHLSIHLTKNRDVVKATATDGTGTTVEARLSDSGLE